MTQLILSTPPALSKADEATLLDLYVRGTPENTLRAYERDLLYIEAWKQSTFEAPLSWPEDEAVALRFILDHSRDLTEAGAAQSAAKALISAGLRKSLNCPAPATLDRRIASWRAFHRMRNLPSPFETPQIRQARAKADVLRPAPLNRSHRTRLPSKCSKKCSPPAVQTCAVYAIAPS